MRRIIVASIIAIAATITSAQQPPTLPQKGSGPGKPLTPQEAQKRFNVDFPLRIELVACEPQIESPVAMAFDPDGRLWVVEMRDYPNGPAAGEKPAGRIRILEDKDGDGFFETSTIWADNLLFANGLFLWKDGAIVTMAPHVVHLRDTKGAGKADTKDVLYEGFAAQNPQLRVSHPILGLDGWVYCANGLRGGKVTRAGKSDNVVDLSGMDFRFDPVNLSKYEAITGPGQYGNTFDEWGNRFVCDNRHHLRHVVMENRYVKRNPYLAAPSLLNDVSILDDGPLSSGGKVYPLSKNWTTSSLHEGRFTAACGVFIYHGNLLEQGHKFKMPHYRGGAFTCEPTGNLVHMEILKPKGASFLGKPKWAKTEFLAATDDWFRPVFLTHGPDGAMYVVDMYRAVIEHPEFMPPELKNRPDLALGKDRGRIWRIVPKGHKTTAMRPNLSKATTADLVKTLEHAEPWWRTTAQRLLLERSGKELVEPLTKLLETTKDAHAQILAAWMLDRIGALDDKHLHALLRSKEPHVLEQAIRIAEPKVRNAEIFRLIAECDNADTRVRYQRALTLGAAPRTNAGLYLEHVVRKGYMNFDDPWMCLAVQTVDPEFAPSVFSLMGEHTQIFPEDPLLLQHIRKFGAMIAAQKDPNPTYNMTQNLNAMTGKFSRKYAAYAGFADGIDAKGLNFDSFEKQLAPSNQFYWRQALKPTIAGAEAVVRNNAAPMNQRLDGLRILSLASWAEAKKALMPLIEKETSPELRVAALRALATQKDKEVPELLMKLWPGASPGVRREILEAMMRQPARVNVLLDEIESTRMKASELDPLRTRLLTNHKDAAIRERAKKLLAANLPADRLTVLKKYQESLTLKGDAKNGREVFKKNCAICHRVAGVGVDVGPDIADTRTKKLDALLFDIIVPNAAIDANYVNYVVSTKDGRILTGLLTAESASSITVLRAEQQKDVILRKDIDEIASTGISLMPDGLEQKMSVREMADLLDFLKNWRYLDGSVPLGSSSK
ncbi:MAG TPA: PVC-type heme-binding CxxCH protein [Gemmataceae bacterium]|nr:PVC-type heme-binding CxxCH protein [Gemmataceae bacterium]